MAKETGLGFEGEIGNSRDMQSSDGASQQVQQRFSLHDDSQCEQTDEYFSYDELTDAYGDCADGIEGDNNATCKQMGDWKSGSTHSSGCDFRKCDVSSGSSLTAICFDCRNKSCDDGVRTRATPPNYSAIKFQLCIYVDKHLSNRKLRTHVRQSKSLKTKISRRSTVRNSSICSRQLRSSNAETEVNIGRWI